MLLAFLFQLLLEFARALLIDELSERVRGYGRRVREGRRQQRARRLRSERALRAIRKLSTETRKVV